MAIIKKFPESLTQNLTTFQTYINDTTPNSRYFRITEFNDTFTGGKNGFLIEGSEHLKETTEIKIEILDVSGNPVYYEPGNGVPEYYEGVSKLIAVYVYEDTPIGQARITVLGELKTFVDDNGIVQDIPEQWRDVYNVKWEKEFKINKLLSNEDKVRFYRRPVVTINEIVKPIFNNVTTTLTQTGSLDGIAQSPRIDEQLSGFNAPTTYLLSINDNTNWTGSVVGTTISIPSLGYSTLADSVITNKNLLVTNPYTLNNLVSNFSNAGYTASFNYVEGANNLKTALTGSFAKISISDLTTFVGDVARVKVFRKSQSDLADYQFVQEIRLESNEILRDLESQIKNEEFYGIFDNSNYKEYWVTSSTDLATSFNQNYLFNSIKFDSNGVNNFYTSKSLDTRTGTEYTLDFNLRVDEISSENYVNVFLSGSIQSATNSNQLIQVKQNIITLTSDNSLLQKNQLTANFKAEQLNNAKLYFEIKGNGWYIADVSLRASQETAYSPDEITFIQSVPRTLPEETFLYRFEFYDINNNFIPVLVEESKTFNGGNLQRIQKGLVFTPRSLQFQFDSGSQPVPPTVVGFAVTKNLLTGSVTYRSQSFDFDGNELFSSDYTASFTGQRYPGLLSDLLSDTPTMTVGNFTGSRLDKTVQLIKITGEVEGFEDTVIFSRVLDGFGGVNHLIRPYNGTQIRNSSTASLELQAIRIDGVNDIELSSTTKPEKAWPDKQLHIISRSVDGAEKFVNLAYASSSGYIYGLVSGSLGSGEINYNAIFNRDSIDFRRTIYLISSQSAASGPAFLTSGSVLASIILEDLQDGLDSGVITYNADSFTINPRTESEFRPSFAFATASFAKRGTAASEIESVTSSFEVYPSMSINKDWVPEYWLYYHTQSLDPTITVVATDENKNIIPSQIVSGNVRTALNQTKNLTLTFTYTEPWTSASVSLDKTFTIVPEGKQGDESIVFEVNPIAITLGANSRGVVNDFIPSITDIRLKQGSRYLAFSASAGVPDRLDTHGTFHIATASIQENRVKAGNVHFTSSFGVPYTASLIVSASSNMTDLSGSITYPLIIHPYYTSSIYTASVVVNYTKVLEGAPPIQIVISPIAVSLTADEVGYITPGGYSAANTTIQVKEGDDFLKLTTTESFANADARKGTYTINSIQPSVSNGILTILTGSFSQSMSSSKTGLTGRINYDRFDYPFISASALYTIQVYPFALGAGHQPTSSIFTRTQTFTKNVSVPNARTVELKANPYTVNYNRDGYRVSPDGDVELKATALNTTGSTWFSLFFVDSDGSETLYDGPYFEGVGITEKTFFIPGTDAAGPEENKTWRVKLTDGNPYTSSIVNPYRAEGQLTIAGIKAGADAYKVSPDNVSTSIKAELFDTDLSGTAIKLPTYKGVSPLINVTSGNYPAPQDTDYDYLQNLIGILGYSSASIFYKSPWIGLQGQVPASQHTTRVLTAPASMPNITTWDKPAINKTGEIIYKIEFEGYSNQVATNFTRPLSRQTEFVTQSFAVQFTEPAPYDIKMQNENSSVVYRVSGEIELDATSNIIRAYRGGYELTNKPLGFTGVEIDAYGSSSYEYQCTVDVHFKPTHITLGGGLNVDDRLTGTPASMPNIVGWDSPETNPTAEIVYRVNCEGRQTFYKTQSLSVQYEGAVGPGIVMRGEWSNQTDYIGKVENTNSRRDAVIYNAVPGTTNYYAAISGSGPNTYVNPLTSTFYVGPTPPSGFNLIGARQPDTQTDYWEFLGVEEFFVAAKIAIFEESYVKNTINVGTVNGTGAFANIVIAGGRTDPYIAIGQNATVGTSGNSGTTLNPGGAVIGYERPGIFLGIYEQPIGLGGTTGRFSIVNGAGNRFLKWDGSGLQIAGDITVTGGDAATQTYANNAANTAADAAEAAAIATSGTNAQTALTVFSGSLGAMAAIDAINAGNDVLTYIGAGAIVTSRVATNLITSTNFGYPGTGNFSTSGTFIDLASSTIRTQGFAVDASGNAFFRGDISAATGNFAGNVIVGGFIRSSGATDLIGTSGTSGFYMQQDGQFRFGNTIPSEKPSIYWDNNTLTIKGRIQTDNSLVSEIGNWRVVEGNFQDIDASIVLNANGKVISINEGSTQRVIIKQGTISDPTSTAGSVTINPVSTITFAGEQLGTGTYNFLNVGQSYDTTGFSVPSEGLFTVATLSWGFDNSLLVDTSFNFGGDIDIQVIAEVWTTPDLSGTQVTSFTLALGYATFPGDTVAVNFSDGYQSSIYFPSAGTYYIHTKVVVEGYISAGLIEFNGYANAQSQTFITSLQQTEIGRDGILVAANQDNYVKIQRTTSDPMIDIKTNTTGPGLRITNPNTGTNINAIEVLAGDILLTGGGNNFIVNGGFIGTQNTTAGIRFGTFGGNSVLMGANWPSQGQNVATARLRPGTTKFGIGGRELIFDSSTLRIKKDIEDYPMSAYESIRRLRPVLYTPLNVINSTTYETDGEEDYENSYPMPNAKEYIGKQGGFIAEWLDEDPEMRKYCSYGVSGSAITVDSLTYDKIVVPLTKAVQILMDKVEALEAYISGSL
jgi:hypothetical protein